MRRYAAADVSGCKRRFTAGPETEAAVCGVFWITVWISCRRSQGRQYDEGRTDYVRPFSIMCRGARRNLLLTHIWWNAIFKHALAGRNN